MKYRQILNHKPAMKIRYALFAPIVYLPLIPLIHLDILFEIYHRLGFPLMGIPYIRRRDHIRIDRQKLCYLKWYEKINCMYCGYVNGWLHYASAIAKETETYWCGITHKKYDGFKPPDHHKDFLPYADKKAFDEFVNK
jgi:hypothetical protein